MRLAVILTVACLNAAGCATQTAPAPVTERILDGDNSQKITGALLSSMVGAGYSLDSESPHQVVFTKSIMNKIPVGMALSFPAGMRGAWQTITFTIVPSGQQTRIIATPGFRVQPPNGQMVNYESKATADLENARSLLNNVAL